MNDFLDLFQYAFIQRAVLAGSFVAIACAALGMFLVLRKMSLIGDGLSHVSFGAIAIGLYFGIYPFAVAVPIAMIASLVILRIAEKASLYGDAAIGIVSVAGFASGIVLTSLSGGFNVDLFGYLFGNILAIRPAEVWSSIVLSVVILAVLAIFYWDLFATTFDEEYAAVSGVRTKALNTALALLTAVTVVLCVKVVGVLLVSALLILPSVAAIQISRRFSSALLFSILISLFSLVSGISVSFLLDLPAGATVVLFLVACFGATFLYAKIRAS
jgi:zinc transport system permease protein